MAQVNAGRVRFVSRGEYNNTTQYYLFDLVNYEGSSYVAIGNTLGNLPTNTTYWQLIAEHGPIGSTGPVGPQGVGIASITKTSTEGLVDTYTIAYTDGTTSTFQVTNGEDGETPLSDFNALKERVEDLEDNQIILSEEGTEIDVDDAAKARLYEFELEKESSQDGEPTPENPIEIKTGKGWGNIFDKDNANVISGYLNNYTITGFERNKIVYIPVEANKTYYLQKTIGISNMTIAYTTDVPTINGQTLGRISTGTKKYFANVPSNANYLCVGVYLDGDYNGNISFEDVLDGLCITEGNEEKPFVPYGNNYINVKIIGKNLFDGKLESGSIISGNNSAATNVVRSVNYVEINENTDYLFSVNNNLNQVVISFYDNNKTWINTGETIGVSVTDGKFKSPANARYLRFRNFAADYNLFQNGNIQIEKGLIATDFEEYKETTIPIPLNNNEIVGKGDYKDELIVDKTGHVYLNKKTNKILLDGSENWTMLDSSIPFRLSITDILLPRSNNVVPSVLSDYYKVVAWNTLSTAGDYCLSVTSTESNLRIRNNDITTLADFKSWLSTHNTVVYYVLETTQLIDLNVTVDLKLSKGVNNITNSEDGNMRIRYVESIESIINDFDTRLKALEEANS